MQFWLNILIYFLLAFGITLSFVASAYFGLDTNEFNLILLVLLGLTLLNKLASVRKR